MGCGASTVAPTADAGGGTSLTRQLTAAIDRTSKSTRVSTLQREAIEEADALLPEYMRLGVAVEWLVGGALACEPAHLEPGEAAEHGVCFVGGARRRADAAA